MIADIASLVCHQIKARSFYFGEEYLPLCSRCTGIYSGFLVAAISQLLPWEIKSIPPLTFKKGLLSLIPVFALIIESIGEKIGLLEWSNYGRFYIGFSGGLGIGIMMLPLCSHFLGLSKHHVTKNNTYQLMVLVIFTVGAFTPLWFHSFLPVLGIFSMLGLILLYLLMNFAVSAKILNLKNRGYKIGMIMLLFGLVLILFTGEWAVFTIFKPQNN